MALIKCPECGRDVSDSAITCPNCGYPLKQDQTEKKTELKIKNSFDSRIVKKPRKDKNKKIIVPGLILLVIIIIIGIVFKIKERNEKIVTATKNIETELSKISDLKGEVYYDDKYDAQILKKQKEFDNAQNSKDVKLMYSIVKEFSDLREEISQEIKSYNTYYASLKNEVERSENLLNDYFAKDYDTSNINTTKDNAQNDIENADFKSYEQAYNDLYQQDNALEQYIKDESGKIFNYPCSNSNTNYPFAVDIDLFSSTNAYEPIVKQTSANPTLVVFYEPKTLDSLPYACLFIDDESAEYTCSVNQIETKEISIQDETHEIKKALVNTEITFKKNDDYGTDKNTALNERPAYLLKTKNGQVYLALKSYDGDDFYLLYQ